MSISWYYSSNDRRGLKRANVNMIDAIQEILEKKFITILEKTPSACFILIDTMGQWHIDDFEIVWFNDSAKQLFGDIISHGKVNFSSNEKLDQVLDNMQTIRQQLLLGQEGFIGPFSSTITNSKGQSVHVDRYSIYLGEIGSSLSTFLVLAHSKLHE